MPAAIERTEPCSCQIPQYQDLLNLFTSKKQQELALFTLIVQSRGSKVHDG